MYVDGPACALTETERLNTGHLDEAITDASRKLSPELERPYCLRSANETVVHIVPDGLTRTVSIVCVTTVPTGPRVVQPSATIDGEAESEQPSQKPFSTRGETVRSERTKKSLASENSSAMTARTQ